MKALLYPVLSVVLLFSACSYVYIPNAANIPLISEKGEIQASVLTGTSNFDVHTAYGVTENVAIMANGCFNNRKSIPDSAFYHNHNMGEIAIGYYKKLGHTGRFEVYGGTGYGETLNYDNLNNYHYGEARGQYAKFFIQPNVGVATDVFDGGLSMRLCYIDYLSYSIFNDNYSSLGHLFLEPVITAKVGYKYVKFISQFGLSLPFNQSDVLSFNPFILNVGIQLKLNHISKKPASL